ncbi:MAG: hypothetical protein Q4E39_03325 [bacterium]|nr:hypothetical protein [bacterium]
MISNLIYHDINIDSMDYLQLNNLINKFEENDIASLFDLKIADLKSQSKEYYYLIDNIDIQRKN